MKTYLTAAILTIVATPIFAEPACQPGDAHAPVWEAIKAFEEEGGEVLKFKINDGGCYEIYGKLSDKKFEVFYDPNTGEEIERIES